MSVAVLLGGDVFSRLCQGRQLLEEVREEPIPIRDIAREIGISPFHFIRQFEAVFGLTPHQFRIQSRLDRAKLLLAMGRHSVTEVCMEVGFASLGSFSGVFARRVGIAPSTYRRRARVMVQVPGNFPEVLFPGCLNLMAACRRQLFRNFREALIAVVRYNPECRSGGAQMRIKLTSIMVNDQSKALEFYTDVLGFRKKHDIPVGEYKWLTVVSPEGPDDVELALEPNANPAAKVFQEAMLAQGIPLAAFEVADIQQEYARLKSRGVVFTREPTTTGPVTIAVFSDSCGNLIQIYQPG